MGIDPGLANTGWSIVEPVGSGLYNVVETGLIKTSKKERLENRICHIADEISAVAVKHNVKFVAAEDIFFTKNISSCIEVAKVIGAFVHALAKNNIQTTFFTPTKIKQTVSGGGKADKKAIKFMVSSHLVSSSVIKSDHEADSVAAALTFFMELKAKLLIESSEDYK